jgi:hypothetical protein
MVFTAEQKRAHRSKPEVRQRAAEYKRNWNQANREHVNKYMRDHYRARVEGGSTTQTKQSELFDASNNK